MGEKRKQGEGGRVPQARPERSESRMHLSTILVPLSPGPYGISRSVGSNGGDAERAGTPRGGRKRGQKRRKKDEGESGTQEAPETGCGQLFTSWRMIHLGVLTKPVYVDLRGPPPPPTPPPCEKGSIEISIRYRNFHVASLRFTSIPFFFFS